MLHVSAIFMTKFIVAEQFVHLSSKIINITNKQLSIILLSYWKKLNI